jgi:hypothetical protein
MRIPAIVRCFQDSKLVGSLVRKIIMAINIAKAPNAVRQNATPTGVRKLRESSINRNEAPHIKPATKYIATQGFFVAVLIFF